MLYEMLTGRRAFEAQTKSGVIAAILEQDPPAIKSFKPAIPHSLERALMKCLAKLPERRWQTAADLRDELVWIAEDLVRVPAESTVGSRSISKKLWPWLAIASGLIVSSALGWWWRPIVERPSLELALPSPPGTSFHWLQAGAISPDGQMMVFVAVSAAKASFGCAASIVLLQDRCLGLKAPPLLSGRPITASLRSSVIAS